MSSRLGTSGWRQIIWILFVFLQKITQICRSSENEQTERIEIESQNSDKNQRRE